MKINLYLKIIIAILIITAFGLFVYYITDDKPKIEISSTPQNIFSFQDALINIRITDDRKLDSSVKYCFMIDNKEIGGAGMEYLFPSGHGEREMLINDIKIPLFPELNNKKEVDFKAEAMDRPFQHKSETIKRIIIK